MQSQRDDVGEFIGFLKTALLIFAGVALFVAAFLIFNTFSITVAQRTREFAMLRTLGANRRQILSSVVVEAFADRARRRDRSASSPGSASRPLINSLFKALGIDLPSTGTVIAARTVIVGLLLGTGLTVVAAFLPALRATRVPPVAGLRDGAVPATTRERRARTIAAICLIAAGLGLMVARPLRRPLAGRGLGRDRRRGGPARGRAAEPAAGHASRLARRCPARDAARDPRAAGARERDPQPGPHRLDRGGADDRARAGLIRRRVRRRPAWVDRRCDRQDDRR